MTSKLNLEKINLLKQAALNLRIDSIKATTASKSGHPTTCMAISDLTSVIFFNFLKYDLNNPENPNNDRFILSAGHAIPVIYAVYKNLGILTEEDLLKLREFDSVLEGHPTPRFKYNEAATGSLGQGLGIAVGMALNAKHDNLNYKTYCLIGDGEAAEGSVWEAAELAAHYKLDNLIAILNCNRLGQSGESIHGHDVNKFADKFKAFGFKTFIIDGHNIQEIYNTIELAQNIKDQPVIIIAKTLKGSGLKEIENKNNYHGKPFKQEELDNIIKELESNFNLKYINKINYTPELPEKVNLNNKNLNTKLNLEQDINNKFFEKNSKIATRKAFGLALEALGQVNNNIFVLDADVQNSTYTEFFAKKYPQNFIQCFIAEQNMISVATGLQSRGKIPFAATFSAFFTRAFDQIRMAGIGRNALRLCGSHSGVSIGQDGPSQMGLEDIAMFRVIPESIVLYPSDGVSAYKLTEIMANYNSGVSYLRTSRPETAILYNKNEEFKIGGCKILRESNNDKVCVIAAGITLHEALKAHDELLKQNINISIIDLYSIKPLDKETILKIAKKSGNKIITVEDHYLQGGLGQAVNSELINENILIKNLAVTKLPRSANEERLLSFEEIDANAIVKNVINFI